MTKKKNVALILWFFGLHRFYIGGKPILFLLTVGGLMVWWDRAVEICKRRIPINTEEVFKS